MTGKYDYNTKFAKEDDRSFFLYGQTLISRVDMVNKIIKHFRLNSEYDILRLSLNYLLSNDKISTIIPGVSKTAQLPDILRLCDIARITQDEFCKLEDFVKANFTQNEYSNY